MLPQINDCFSAKVAFSGIAVVFGATVLCAVVFGVAGLRALIFYWPLDERLLEVIVKMFSTFSNRQKVILLVRSIPTPFRSNSH